MVSIIGITGTLGAGKGTIAQYLKEHKNYNHISARDYLIQELKKRKLEINRDTMLTLANDLREQNSSSYIIEQLYKMAKQTAKNTVIESIRTTGEVEALKDKEDFHLFSIDADPKMRYERITLRKSQSDNVSYEKFLEDEKREMTSNDPNKSNITKCIMLADYKFTNNSNVERLHKEIEKVITTIANSKRKNYISWDDYFMGIAILSAQRSKDPSTQVGACIVNQEKKIVGIGYNGWPTGIHDDLLPWSREGNTLNTKYAYVVHAEQNAIMNATTSLKGCSIYIALAPCNECAKLIIQSGIKEVVYMSNKYADLDIFIASRKMLDLAGVKMRKHIPKQKTITINM